MTGSEIFRQEEPPGPYCHEESTFYSWIVWNAQVNALIRHSKLVTVAIAGGSGAGKSWLAKRLLERFGKEATCVSLDNFYRDLSHLAPRARQRVNFDHPRAIDWPLLERVLECWQAGRPAVIPTYDFALHTRQGAGEWRIPSPVLILEGLWTLRRPAVRRSAQVKIFLECPEEVRFRRRLERDVVERGRSEESIVQQFRSVVAPMHRRYVDGQARWADLALAEMLTEEDVDSIANRIRTELRKEGTT